MLEYTGLKRPIEVTATEDNALRGTAQVILLVVARGILLRNSTTLGFAFK